MKLWEIPSSYAASTLPREWNFHANFMFIISNLLTSPDQCTIFTRINPESPQSWYDSFILTFPPYFIIKGVFPKKLLLDILPQHTEFNLVFESAMLPIIDEFITERKVTDPSGEGQENHFLCMTLLQRTFISPSCPLNDVKAYLITSYAEYCQHGWNPAYLSVPIGAGLAVIGNVGEGVPRSIAPATNLITKAGFSFAIIRGIYTHPSYRNRGYAQHAIAKLAQFLFKEYKIAAINLWVEEQNQSAVAVYKKLGFKITGTILGCICSKSLRK